MGDYHTIGAARDRERLFTLLDRIARALEARPQPAEDRLIEAISDLLVDIAAEEITAMVDNILRVEQITREAIKGEKQ